MKKIRYGLILLGLFSLSAFESRARIGDSLKGLEGRYGIPEEREIKEGGLVVIKYKKEELGILFSLLDDKTEKVEITGDLSDEEVEVFLTRNCPPGVTFSQVQDSRLLGAPCRWYKFSNKMTGSLMLGTLTIKTSKMEEFDARQASIEKENEKNKAKEKVDKIESASSLEPKKEPSSLSEGFPEVRGGAQLGEDAPFASMATALGRYQHKLYLAIGDRWNLSIQGRMAQIGVDKVVIRFHVNPDGSISDLDVVQGNPNSMLGFTSADSIRQSSGLIGPFPAELLREKPNGFPWQLAFRIY